MNGRLPPCRCNLVAQTLETSDVEISESKFASGQEKHTHKGQRESGRR